MLTSDSKKAKRSAIAKADLPGRDGIDKVADLSLHFYPLCDIKIRTSPP